MPRSEEANQRVRAAQRAKILEGAKKAFARKRWSATISDVAAAANVSQGLAYRYFPSKEAIIEELVKQATETSAAALQGIVDSPLTPGERLHLLVSSVLEKQLGDPEFYQLAILAFDDESIPDSVRERLRQPSQAFRDVMRQLIVEGQTTGEVAAGDPDQLVIAVNACLAGLSRLALRNTEQAMDHLPDARIILRLLKSENDSKER